jgi:NAD(P)-dependent dehydrogenase (short-subunit alcohol dehydrogenase family)
MGAACAKMLISKNKDWKVVIGDVNVKGGEKVAESLGKDCVFVKCDASKYEDILKLFTTAKEKFGRVDFGMSFCQGYANSSCCERWCC